MPSARSQALQLPEILSSVFDAICDESRWQYVRTLLSCTLVNKVWNDEANRRLWEHCGENADYIFNIPGIRDFLALDSTKQQKFANYIRSLHIRYLDLSGDELDWTGRFLPELRRFSFPYLEEIAIDMPLAHDPTTYPALELTQFAQPSLRRIQISASDSAPSFGISEQWLLELSQHSRGLTNFCYSSKVEDPLCSVSPAVFTSFLENMQCLEHLVWYLPMSEDAIMVLANNAALGLIDMSVIADAWLGDRLQSATPGRLFENLQHLTCKISMEGLKKLAPHLESLCTLSLVMIGESSEAIPTLCRYRLTNLCEFILRAGRGDIIYAEDLLALAKGSPLLAILDLAQDKAELDQDLPVLRNMDDNTIKDLALSLPNLVILRLISLQNSGMTEQSLLILGKQCPSLETCALSMIPDFEKLMQEADGFVWTRLRHFSTHGIPTEPESQTWQALLPLSRRIKEAMPLLNSVWFETHHRMCEALVDIMGEDYIGYEY